MVGTKHMMGPGKTEKTVIEASDHVITTVVSIYKIFNLENALQIYWAKYMDTGDNILCCMLEY